MDSAFLIVAGVVALAVCFDFMNGYNDAANIVATVISSRSIPPERALKLAAACEFIGPFLFGTAVAKTIGKGIVDPSIINVWVVASALIGAILWNVISAWRGIPSSSSHALVGGITGSVIVGAGFSQLKLAGFAKIVTVLIMAPVVSFFVGYAFQSLFTNLSRSFSPKLNRFYKNIQHVSLAALALSHGGNDAQKSMGMITMVLVASGMLGEFSVPLWVVLVCAAAISTGTFCGGWRIIKTVGEGIYKLRPIHSFSTQSGAAFVIISAATLGWPVSTSHVVSSGIMGVGSAERIKAVRWFKAGEIVLTWIITIPASALIGALVYLSLEFLRSVI